MRSTLSRRVRRLAVFAASACTVATSFAAIPHAGAAPVPLSIRIVGNHFVNGAGRTVRLLGVNHTSAEYGCVDGFGYDDGHFTSADAAAVASWGADAVRVPLNEDCWLGINGQPNSSEGADPALTESGYRHEIVNYVGDLARHGIYAILDLHWTAPGTQVALEQQPMPDLDHSPAFWASVASTFRTDHAVVFDLFNEPYDPTDPRSGDDPNAGDKVTWNCWETGTQQGPAGGAPCLTSAYDENEAATTRYRVAGLQTLLNAVRHAGAKQPVMAGGLDFANDLGIGDHGGAWMNHAPNDPLDQEAASFHNYMGEACDTLSCWKGTLAPIAAHVPVVTGEFDEDNFDEAKCAVKRPSSFDAQYMSWADRAGVSYLAWGWIVSSRAEQDSAGCSSFDLITNYSHYTPSRPNGVALRTHLHALAYPNLQAFAASVGSGNAAAGFTVRSSLTCAAALAAVTLHAYGSAKQKPRQLSLGSARVTLRAGRSATVSLELPTAVKHLLVAKGSLAVRVTITLAGPQRRTVFSRTVTLHAR